MSDLISSGDSEVKEAAPVDYMGTIKFAGWAIIGLLTILGLTWLDLFDSSCILKLLYLLPTKPQVLSNSL